tara:strand:- start:446 stop:667 length:222 start_codon:yes stop_codon:yes gene_type:complete
MKAKDKARELVGYYFNEVSDVNPLEDILVAAKKCAFICVYEILKENKRINLGGAFPTPLTEYWKEVKQEIEKL